MESKISYYEFRERGGTQVDVTASPRNSAELELLLTELRGPQVAPPPGQGPPGTIDPPVDFPPSTRTPYFDVGDAQGKAGEIVEIPVVGGVNSPINGFHIGGGVGKLDEPRSGYGLFRGVGATLGPFLTNYLESHGMGDAFWSIFQFVQHDPNRALPEEWWEYAMAFFSISQERPPLPSIHIPANTLLFTLRIEIQAETPPGVYELTCLDEHYYTHAVQRRRKFLWTNEQQGVDVIDTHGGKLTVIA